MIANEMKVSITVDVEDFFFPRPLSDAYFAKIDGEYWGITKIMDICESYGAKATFFVDVHNVEGYVDEGLIREACQEIERRGHEVGLHTHPPKRTGKQYINDRVMCNYEYDFQYAFMLEGAEKIQKWTGKFPESHRTGSYAANADTFKALEKAKIYIDSSVFWGLKDYNFISNSDKYNISVFKIGNTFEIPIVSYKLELKFLLFKAAIDKKTDVNWASLAEMKKLIETSRLQRIDIFLHSYSLLKVKSWKPNQYYVKNFHSLLDLVVHPDNNYFIKDLKTTEEIFYKPLLQFSLIENSLSDFYNIYLSKLNLKFLKRRLSKIGRGLWMP